MSENEPLINFNCACGKPVQTPASLRGQKLHCPYEGCEAIIEAPPAADASAEPAAAEAAAPASGPRKPRMPPPKGFKGGKGKELPAPAKKPRPPAASPAKEGDKPAASPASETAPAAETPAPPKKKNKLFFAACSGITLIAAVVILNGKDKKPAATPAPAPAVAPAKPAPAAAPAQPRQDPAPPVEGGGRKPRQQVDADAVSARLAEKLAEQKKAAAGARKNLVTAAENGASEEWIALAEDLLQHDGEENRAEARKWLEKAAARRTSKAFLLLGGLEESHGSREKAVEYYVQGAASIASGKSEARDAKLEAFAVRLDRLEAAAEAAKIRARIAGEAKAEAKPAHEAKPAPAPAPKPAAEPKPAPVEEVPGIPEPPAPAVPAPAVPAPAEEVPGIPEPPAAPAVPAPAEEVPGIPEPPAPNGL